MDSSPVNNILDSNSWSHLNLHDVRTQPWFLYDPTQSDLWLASGHIRWTVTENKMQHFRDLRAIERCSVDLKIPDSEYAQLQHGGSQLDAGLPHITSSP